MITSRARAPSGGRWPGPRLAEGCRHGLAEVSPIWWYATVVHRETVVSGQPPRAGRDGR
jgi:hypothetical protein